MKTRRCGRWIVPVLMTVAVLLTTTGCDDGAGGTTTFLDVLNTVFLGITAAGGIAILRNV